MRVPPFVIYAVPLAVFTVAGLAGIGLWADDAIEKSVAAHRTKVDYTHCPREVGDMELLSFRLAWDNRTQTDCRYVRKGKRS